MRNFHPGTESHGCWGMNAFIVDTHAHLPDCVGDPPPAAHGGISVETLCWDDGKDWRQDEGVVSEAAQLDEGLKQMWADVTHRFGRCSPRGGVQPCREAGERGGAGSWWRREAGLAVWTPEGET